MSILLLQTFLLMLTAFFLGALISCLVKSTFFGTSATEHEPLVPATAASGAVATAPSVAKDIAPLPPPRPAPEAVQPKIETVARPAAAPPMPVTDAQRFERALVSSGSTAQDASTPVPATPASTPAATARPVATPPPAPAGGVPTIDRGAMAAAAAAAAALGSVPSVPKPAAASPPAVLEPPMRPAMPVATESSAPAAVVADVAFRPAPAASAGDTSPDDFTRIRAIDGELQERLYDLGVAKYSDIAGWTSADVKRIGSALGIANRISSENWIEQAQILAKGGSTDYDARRRAQSDVVLSSPSADQGTAAAVSQPEPAPSQPAPPAPAQGFELPRTGAQAAAAAAAAIAAAAAASRRSAPSEAEAAANRDSFQRIKGIDADIEKRLFSAGVTRFAQIAAWGEPDVAHFTSLLGAPGRIARENWIEQASILAGGAATYARRNEGAPRTELDATRPARLMDAIRERESAPPQAEPASAAPADAPAPPAPAASGSRPDLSHLRSIRSEALRKDAAVGAVDDLKRIRGIGVLIEKKLNSLGVASYEQIANWTSADVDRMSQLLDFKGRIERESWVEQARILASGGHTEFSVRVDKSDV